MNPLIDSDWRGNSPEKVGGKAHHLLKMKEKGLPVPGFVILSCPTVDSILKPVRAEIGALSRQLSNADNNTLIRLSESIRHLVLSCEFPKGLRAKLEIYLDKNFEAETLFAIRSSAAAEDSAKFSFAGQHQSFLWVEREFLTEKIMETIASAWNVNALKYRILNKLPLQNIQMAVVLQKMVQAAKSGVSFSADINGNLDDIILTAGFGMGEGIVNNLTETDTFFINKQSGDIRSRIEEKQHFLDYDPVGKVIEKRKTPAEKAKLPVLDESEIRQVQKLTLLAETILKAPVDLEFSIDSGGMVHVLQMRPISTIDFKRLKILDNTNIVESYPGITLPLSFSFALDAYERIFRQTAKIFLLPKSKMESLQSVFANLLAHAYGRVYYRLDNWYPLIYIAFGSKSAMIAWENAVGLARGESASRQFGLWNRLRSALVTFRLILDYKNGNRWFFENFESDHRFFKNYEPHLISPAALWRHYEIGSEKLFESWHLTILNDLITFKSFGWLQKLITRYGISNQPNFLNDLFCGQKGIESQQVIIEMLGLKENILDDPDLKILFELPTPEIMRRLEAGHFPDFFQSLKNFLENYGDRNLAELKLETKSFRKAPHLFIDLLKKQIPTTVSKEALLKNQMNIQEGARQVVEDRLSRWDPRYWLFRWVWNLAAYGMKNRENMRFCRTKAYGTVKDIFYEIGKFMTRDSIIADPDDVFYLNMGALKNYCLHKDLSSRKTEVQKQKEAFAKFESLQLPDRIIYEGDRLPDFSVEADSAHSMESSLKGLGVSKGKVKARAIVLQNPSLDTDVKGKILITRMTDPGWVFLMIQSAGVICEKGSLLSHTSIIGRELGIPVIVGIKNATRIFRDEQLIFLDADEGLIQVLD